MVHGKDQEHDFHPISRKSSKNAIGKKFLEKYYKDLFSYGRVIMIDGTKMSIPRYYEKWFQKHHPDEWLCYIERVKSEKIAQAEERSKTEEREYFRESMKRLDELGYSAGAPITKVEMEKKIVHANFQKLQSYLKGDI